MASKFGSLTTLVVDGVQADEVALVFVGSSEMLDEVVAKEV